MSLLQVENLYFKYDTDRHFSLNINQFSVNQNSHVFIEGPSGCGKTTFLNILTGLLKPIDGHIHMTGTDITTLSAVKRDQFRADHFGIIFQLFNLIPYLSVLDNIILPCTFSQIKKEKALKFSNSLVDEAKRLCKKLDIHKQLIEKPVQHLSIGQQQRVAIARALIGQPEIIIADEPTSALDPHLKEQFMAFLLMECTANNASLIFVSHDLSLKSHFDHDYQLNQLNQIPGNKTHVSV